MIDKNGFSTISSAIMSNMSEIIGLVADQQSLMWRYIQPQGTCDPHKAVRGKLGNGMKNTNYNYVSYE